MVESVAMPSGYCPKCGQPQYGGNFCPKCGASIAVEAQAPTPVVSETPVVATPPVTASAATTPPLPDMKPVQGWYQDDETPNATAVNPVVTPVNRPNRSNKALIIGGACAVVALGVTLAISGASSQSSGSSYNNRVATAMQPLLAQNQVLAAAANALGSAGRPTTVETDISQTLNSLRAARATVSGLTHPDAATQSKVQNALDAEQNWLTTAAAALHQASSASASQLSPLGVVATTDFGGLSFLGHVAFPSSTPIQGWITSTGSQLGFISSVQQILASSAAVLPTLNQYYGGLNSVVNGNGSPLTLNQYESYIASIISTRQALLAQTQSLPTTTNDEVSVKNLLAASFTASLADDNAISSCLYQNNNGYTAYIASSCLAASQPDDLAATNAKAAFRTAYNALRGLFGLAPNSNAF